ncbi:MULTISPECIES: OmpW/AlkL family protein [Alphaproteobacteria]|uniref:Outer membrane protein n=2 Tax=Alphaproteobacteria TaxID=28211 RepID=A0A512HJ02_9HYPH|nr:MULTISPECIES: OmpW family protein [Alphaproteobacteria]GEO85417.1 outer membrane protein [Ciceribacter naphthalenivorans]GLR21561.1 outer membrane protein [Ciceribacter naphthalenivorans]GLT04417.1 outer membrane protein [Sphingomonas psychrolutea]
MTKTSTRRISALAAATAFLLIGQAAGAADMTPVDYAAPEASSIAAQSPWQIRVRGLGVISQDEGHVNGIAGSDLSYSDTVIPELDITYYFTDNIAAELILGTTYANVWGEGSVAGLGKIGRTWILPPTLTLQYHFTDFGAFKPYVGAGLNYTIFYNEDGANAADLNIDNAFGAALQVGFDYMVDEHWGVNFDVKKIFLEPDFTANVGADVSGKAKLSPWLVGAGVTYRF